jgi:hypothetical protein
MEICLKCKVAYKTKKGGIVVEEMAGFGSYQLWAADLKECPKCNHQIIAGFAKEPFSEHWKEGHAKSVETAKGLGVLFEWRE